MAKSTASGGHERAQHKDPSINAMIRRLQPKAVINNRGFDAVTSAPPERTMKRMSPPALTGRRSLPGGRYGELGYRKDEDYYTDRH